MMIGLHKMNTYFVFYLLLVMYTPRLAAEGLTVDFNTTTVDSSDCEVSHYDQLYVEEMSMFTKEGIKAVEIYIVFEGNARDPLDIGNQFAYDLNVWGRANTPQGMPIVELLFHFDLTELATWVLGIKNVTLLALDDPPNCVSRLIEDDKMAKLIELFSPKGSEKYCHKIVKHEENSTIAVFSTRCCYWSNMEQRLICEEEPENYWLTLLADLLTCLRCLAIFLGPLVLSKNLQNEKFYNFHYFIIPKIPEKMFICNNGNCLNDENQHKDKIQMKIPLSENIHNFQCFQKLIANHGLQQKQKPCLVEFTKYKISVNHKWLISEIAVPVGLWRRFADALAQRSTGKLPKWQTPSRLNLYKKLLGQILLIFALPVPYYIRIAIYYLVELPKINSRWKIAQNYGLDVHYNWDLICYLTPLHTLWIILYANHVFITAMMVSSPDLINFRLATQIRNVAHHSLAGLEHIRRQHGLKTLTRFLIWPFKQLGHSAIGLLFAPLWLIFALPFVIIVLILYIMPLFYLCMRILIGSPIWSFGHKNGEHNEETQKETKEVKSFKGVLFDIFNLFRVIQIPEECSAYYDDQYEHDRKNWNLFDNAANVIAKILVFMGLLASMLIFAECIGFLVDVTVLLLTGIIANAENHFKYVSIVILIVFYSWDVFRDVKKVYRKLNSAMFVEIENQVPELQSVLNLPSNKQENTAFVAYINGESNQRNLTFEGTNLKVNHLALFVDHYDTPRIPRQLFEEMAKVEIIGTPGPILKNYIRAFIQLAAILLFLLFIFLIILTLGQDYALSSGTSLFATVIGGLLPMFLRIALKPIAAEVQLESLSFKGKLNEKISKLQQKWPLVDLEFRVCDDQSHITTDMYDMLIIDNDSIELNFSQEC